MMFTVLEQTTKFRTGYTKMIGLHGLSVEMHGCDCAQMHRAAMADLCMHCQD